MKIPNPIPDFIKAINHHNPEALLAVLADNAVLQDEGHEYHGIAEIKKWSDERVFGANVVLEPVKVMEHNGNPIVTFKIDGIFDKTGLPDPLHLDFHFTLDANKVTALSILLPE
jgi:hypothetical protein